MRKIATALLLIAAAACSSPLGLDHTTDNGSHTTDNGSHTTDNGSHTTDNGS